MHLSLFARMLPLLAGVAASGFARGQPPASHCVPIGAWRVPGDHPASFSTAELLGRFRGARVVLLGEDHDDPEHHRWQLAVLAAWHGRNPKLVLGLEMFPRRVQPVLERWVAGELSEAEFLRQVEWSAVWGYPSDLYLPLFDFARMHRLRMVALNVDRSLIREVGAKGFDGVDEAQRDGVTRPAPPPAAYLARLRPVFAQHGEDLSGGNGGDAEARFAHFVDSQQVWDRGMAQRITQVLLREPDTTVVAIMGWQHVAHGHGVAHQLRSLGVVQIASLLPWDAARDCEGVEVAGIADAVFGLAPVPVTTEAPNRPRLGVFLDRAEGGVRISEVLAGSVAESSGLRVNDVIIESAGLAAQGPEEVIGAVQRQAPGTWLPIKVRRGAETLEVVAKFPPRMP